MTFDIEEASRNWQLYWFKADADLNRFKRRVTTKKPLTAISD